MSYRDIPEYSGQVNAVVRDGLRALIWVAMQCGPNPSLWAPEVRAWADRREEDALELMRDLGAEV